MSITNLDITHIQNSLKGNLIGSEIYYHSVIGSTMNESKQLADNGCLEGTVVIAEDQQSGRGRFNRNWLSNPGKSITLSVILRPKPELLSFLNMASTLSVVRTIEKIVDHEVVIKWPNDVKIGNKKVSLITKDDINSNWGPWYRMVDGLTISGDVLLEGPEARIIPSLRMYERSVIASVSRTL